MQDYVRACRRYLASKPEVLAVLGSDVKWDTWLFERTLYVTVEGSESVAAVLYPAGSWTSPNRHNTAYFPRVRVEFFADPSRDSLRNVTAHDAWGKVVAAFTAFDQYLHVVDGDRLWDTVRVFSCVRGGELTPYPVQDTDGVVRAEVYYDLGVG